MGLPLHTTFMGFYRNTVFMCPGDRLVESVDLQGKASPHPYKHSMKGVRRGSKPWTGYLDLLLSVLPPEVCAEHELRYASKNPPIDFEEKKTAKERHPRKRVHAHIADGDVMWPLRNDMKLLSFLLCFGSGIFPDSKRLISVYMALKRAEAQLPMPGHYRVALLADFWNPRSGCRQANENAKMEELCLSGLGLVRQVEIVAVLKEAKAPFRLVRK